MKKTRHSNVSNLRSAPVVALSLVASMLLAGCLGGGGGGTSANGTDTVAATSSTSDTTGTSDPGSTLPPTNPEKAAVLVWTAPTTNVDGSTLVDLAGYHVYVGTTTSDLQPIGNAAANQTNYTKNDLAPGTYYFAVTAYNSSGAESEFSNIGTKTISN